MNFTPTCRYGHGNLEAQTGVEGYTWVIPAIDMELFMDGDSWAQGWQAALPGVYTIRLFRCPTCGYVEMFDAEVPNGSA